MIKLYSYVDNQIKLTTNYDECKWIDVVNPSLEEIETIINNYHLDRRFIKYSLDEEEISRLIKQNDEMLVLIDIPLTDSDKHPVFYTLPLGIIIHDNRLITICSKEYRGLRDFSTNYLNLSLNNFSLAVLDIINRVTSSYLNNLKSINKQVEALEKNLKNSTKNKEIFKLINLQKSLVYFRTSLVSNNKAIEIISKDSSYMVMPLKEVLEYLIIENKQAIETAGIYSEIINGLMDAFASIISNNLNTLMKFLAGITIVFSIPTTIASFMGMNIPLGFFAESDFAFIYIILISLSISFLVAYILKRKNML